MDAMKRTRPADRFLAEQIAGVAEAIGKNEDRLMRFLPRFGWSDLHQAVEPGTCQLYDPVVLARRMEEADMTEKVLKIELQRAKSLGPVRRLARAPGSGALRELAEAFPHFHEVLNLIRQRCSLAGVTPGMGFGLPPILLSGPAGVGKTAFAEAVAETLGQPIQRVDIAAATAGFALAGSHETWGGARHGAVWSLLQCESASGVLMLEEIDKQSTSNYPVLGSLYALLEPVSATHFKDEYIGMDVDASRLIVLATCNQGDQLEPALRSRFREFQIPLPTMQEMPAIARSIHRRMRATQAWAAPFPEELPTDVLMRLAAVTPRQVYRLLEDAHARAAADRRLHLLPEDIEIPRSTHDGAARKIGFI